MSLSYVHVGDKLVLNRVDTFIGRADRDEYPGEGSVSAGNHFLVCFLCSGTGDVFWYLPGLLLQKSEREDIYRERAILRLDLNNFREGQLAVNCECRI